MHVESCEKRPVAGFAGACLEMVLSSALGANTGIKTIHQHATRSEKHTVSKQEKTASQSPFHTNSDCRWCLCLMTGASTYLLKFRTSSESTSPATAKPDCLRLSETLICSASHIRRWRLQSLFRTTRTALQHCAASSEHSFLPSLTRDTQCLQRRMTTKPVPRDVECG
jgi:iron only hydrogenase large subunit-like protein